MLRNQDLLDPTSRAAKLFRRHFRVPHVFFLTLVRRVIEEGWFPIAEVDVVGRPCISVTLKVSNFTQYLLNVDSGVDNTVAVDMNDSSVAVATTEGCCTNSLPAARAAVYLFLYRARALSQQPRAFDRAMV